MKTKHNLRLTTKSTKSVLHSDKYRVSQRFTLILFLFFMLPNFSFGQNYHHDHSKCGTNIPEPDNKFEIYTPESNSRSSNCTGVTITKYVNVNFHFMWDWNIKNFTANDDGQGNTNYTGYDRAKDLVNQMNNNFQNNIQMSLPLPNNTPVDDINIQYVLSGVYFPKSYPQYTNEAIDEWTINRDYGINQVEEINILC